MDKKDSFVVYRSFYDAMKPLPEADQLQLFRAIFEYGLNHKEIELDDLPTAMFALIKPQLEANYKRWLNGNKGGRKTKTEPKPNLDLTKTKPNVNVNANVNDNVKKNIKKKDIEVYKPNETTLKAIEQVYPNCNIDALVDDFKDQAKNRKQPFKDLDAGFRNYLKRGWISPYTEKKQLSHSQMASEMMKNPLLTFGDDDEL